MEKFKNIFGSNREPEETEEAGIVDEVNLVSISSIQTQRVQNLFLQKNCHKAVE